MPANRIRLIALFVDGIIIPHRLIYSGRQRGMLFLPPLPLHCSNTMQLPDDPIMVEMLPDYVLSWQHDISTKYSEIVSSKNEEELFRFGHTLKGSSRQFCVPQMAEYGATIQQLARAREWDSAQALLEPMLTTIEGVKHYLVSNGLMQPESPSSTTSNVSSNL